jgi:hypothetical protein
MLANLTPPVDDLLAAMLARGDAPTLDALLDLCPDEPLADVDEIDREGMTAGRHAEWWSWATDLRIQYPGFQDAYWYLEYMKYGRSRGPLPDRPLPYAGAPLSEFVGARISHAKALWSRDVSCRWTSCSFATGCGCTATGRLGYRRSGLTGAVGLRRCRSCASRVGSQVSIRR